MGKRIKDYVSKMMKLADEMTAQNSAIKQNKEEVLREMLVQIGFFQHERFIHLIVTVLFAFLTIFTMACSSFSNSSYFGILFCILSILCLILLVPYIHHYYVLENNVQQLYEIYDAIKADSKVDNAELKNKKTAKK